MSLLVILSVLLITSVYALDKIDTNKSSKEVAVLGTYYNEFSDYRFSLITYSKKTEKNRFFVDSKISNSTIITANISASAEWPRAVNVNEHVFVLNKEKLFYFNYSSPNKIITLNETFDTHSPIEVVGDFFMICQNGTFSIFSETGKLTKKTEVQCGSFVSHGHDILAIKRNTNTSLYRAATLSLVLSYQTETKGESDENDPMVVNVFDVVFNAITTKNLIEVRSPFDYKTVETINVPFYLANETRLSSYGVDCVQTYGSVLVVGLFGQNKGRGVVELFYDNFAVLHREVVRFVKIGKLGGGDPLDYKGISASLTGDELIIGGMYPSVNIHQYSYDVRELLKKHCNGNDCVCPRGYYLNEQNWKCYVVINIGQLIIITLASIVIFVSSMIILVLAYRSWALASPAIPPMLSPSYLSYGYPSGDAPLHKQLEQNLTITNASDTPMHCVVELPKSYRAYYTCSPPTVDIQPFSSENVIITITILCTSYINEGIVVSSGECAVKVSSLVNSAQDYIIDSSDFVEENIQNKSCLGVFRHFTYASDPTKSGIVMPLNINLENHEKAIDVIKSQLIFSEYLFLPKNIGLSPNALFLVFDNFVTILSDVPRKYTSLLLKICIDVTRGLKDLRKREIDFKELCAHNVIVVSSDIDKICGKITNYEIPFDLLPQNTRICSNRKLQIEDELNESGGKRKFGDVRSLGVMMEELFQNENATITALVQKLKEQNEEVDLDDVIKSLTYCLEAAKTSDKSNLIYQNESRGIFE
ncbi:hypothetical protein EIN_227110 [Entamoeba invadens IP1]|uniref:Sema domain-containing protein n=1 Tax=Entamoeba invadens IP1 TaxID=370355 RepID=A0A0A1U8J7_ENTIV|nr:hypothetical protein EIN_227110 [Entamoeba invadens IP1]ELP88308.1 hypothetical protein EIN_227110 [Entamoeba invadens IP1]|eukprot:XP_004255079.1 hypothetical protein EIN_227110 [Entamoeba invadens IP1]